MHTKTQNRAPAARRGRPARTGAAVKPAVVPAAVEPLSEARGAKEKERGGIQSLERAFAILEEIAAHPEGIALAELCKSVGLHSSTTFHLVRTLVQLGFASQLPESRKYKIGRKLFSLAAGALDESELIARATPMLELLSQYTGESAHFAIRSGDDVVIAAKTEGPGIFQMADRAGAVRPANATALGKVLLAALTPEQLDRYFARTPLQRFTPKTIVEREALLAELAEVRRDGIAFDDGEYNAEVRCVAVPVCDFLGRVAGAIGISGPMWRLSLQSLHEKSRHVLHVANQLSGELGHRGGSTAKVA
jgi:IclR family transcriptional regulator, KDG regulon repressor